MQDTTPSQVIVACGRTVDIDSPVVLWNHAGGFRCPHPRGRASCHQHPAELNDAPTQPFDAYRIADPDRAYEELTQTVHQLVLHYDVCYTSRHCHEVLQKSAFMGSHFYLDLDGTLYQTCDLYWKTNTAPADDRKGNERAIHVEMANLSWQARAEESDLYRAEKDAYVKQGTHWRLQLPQAYRNTLRTPGFVARPARTYGQRGYFSRRVNGRMVRMWDFTEQQYEALIRLCFGVHALLPGIGLKVPFDKNTGRTPLSRLRNFATFRGILGHFHVQAGTTPGVKCKYDPGSAFDWGRVRRALETQQQTTRLGNASR
ncbi:putative N-acetylmuramyl-L-alanine amidase, negative regulator of AmpC, AmpD [Nitrospina gracilis 3/211]|uniref:Putative N-acetylmuramyl-L-alanine amidase, negative regulator of AmpC, AmpD n=1 Tax=Nitrospina gracilis (strain 3/211) TaxID=1266370 RepID=M1Z2D1_NITG3|nr:MULTISPECIES: N-acetylmuramoyl-L-alanine amidase [Nitrospina]MCF8722472.1 N-acetyl-anhydromuramyl-L-alanine amidase AmpD [Nitrospina sp. Nb-3]CCQ91901.1 putative N-acetylmuramyl-L-alanine amidase, negative regulator of AmpC, AmpD [Nitrospina gracilis 3/211]